MMNRQQAIEFAESSAFMALDQTTLYGTIQDTIDTFRENVRDTLNEQHAAEFEPEAFEAFDAIIRAKR